ncbi:PAS domain-containing protein [Flavobacterium cellulosilyticum]|nr:PAS domain-containing protein [Flavobacterium cellulosilyticum]
MSFDILSVAKDNYFIKINPAFTRTLGYDEKDIKKIKFMELIHPNDLEYAKEVLEKHCQGIPIVIFRARFLYKDKSCSWIEWSSNIDKKLGIFYSVGRDVSDIVQYEIERNSHK